MAAGRLDGALASPWVRTVGDLHTRIPDEIIGFGGIDARKYLDVERLNLGYRFGTQAWGKGFATELSQASLDYAFAELNVPEVFAVVRPHHQASIRVLERSACNVSTRWTMCRGRRRVWCIG